jgi:hypothetical protein
MRRNRLGQHRLAGAPPYQSARISRYDNEANLLRLEGLLQGDAVAVFEHEVYDSHIDIGRLQSVDCLSYGSDGTGHVRTSII